MKIVGFAPLTATLDLDPTDCLVLADALACALYHDQAPDRNLTAALRAALEACAIVAASDTLRDNNVPEAGMLADIRRLWGPFEHGGTPVSAWTSDRRSARTFWPWPGLPMSEVRASLCYAAAHERHPDSPRQSGRWTGPDTDTAAV